MELNEFISNKYPKVLQEFERYKFFEENILTTSCEILCGKLPCRIIGYKKIDGGIQEFSLYPEVNKELIGYYLQTINSYKCRFTILFKDAYKHLWFVDKPIEICDAIYYKGSTFRVNHFVKKIASFCGGWNEYQYTNFENASHIWGSGVCGCNAPINEAKYVGQVNWSKELVEEYKKEHESRIGKKVVV